MTIQIAKSPQQSPFFSLHGRSLVRHVNSLRASPLGCSGGWAGKGGRAYGYVSGKWISRCKMLIGGDDISNDAIILGTCFSMFVYKRARFRFALMAKIWQLSRRGATGELEVEFKFQRGSCKLSFLFFRLAPEAPGELARRLPCKCRVTQKLRNFSVLYHKTKNFFAVKIFLNISF